MSVTRSERVVLHEFYVSDCTSHLLSVQAANAEVERVEKRGANVIFYFQSVS